MENAWIFWAILGIAMIIAEIFTIGFVLLWFGEGALAAALASILGFGIGVQFVLFLLVSVTLTLMSRTILVKYLSHGADSGVKTGVDSLPGKIGTVTHASGGTMDECAVKVFGSTWTAFPVDGEQAFAEGDKVEVVYVEGSSIFVKRAASSSSSELPEWRGE
jgi:membrane protein implicated in regulation of membrane protease activity